MNDWNTDKALPYVKEEAIETIEKKLEAHLIKNRRISGRNLDYIEGHTVINILNKAFGYAWSFEIVDEDIFQTIPTKDKNGNVREEAHIVSIRGRLTIPGIGVKEQYGSKILLGGGDMQEGAFKSAATDALKKCATLVGVGRELYMDDIPVEDTPVETSRSADSVSHLRKENQTPVMALKEEYVEQIKVLKTQLEIKDNVHLNRYVAEATNNAVTSFMDINNSNAKAIISLMEKDVKEQGH